MYSTIGLRSEFIIFTTFEVMLISQNDQDINSESPISVTVFSFYVASSRTFIWQVRRADVTKYHL